MKSLGLRENLRLLPGLHHLPDLVPVPGEGEAEHQARQEDQWGCRDQHLRRAVQPGRARNWKQDLNCEGITVTTDTA